jgi:murein DD-endopeptidase MepM/ murein hydrolase activator NlpD
MTAQVWGFEIRQGDVTLTARALQPGEVVLLKVEQSSPVSAVVAEVFGKELQLSTIDQGETWDGLVGIDLSEKIGHHRIKVRVTNLDGSSHYLEPVVVEILAKKFPTRKLSVDNKYVEPSAESLKRIRAESARVSKILATATPTRYWKGEFARPVPGEASSSFGKRSILNGKPRSPHSGTDFKASSGTPIKSPNSGVIVLVADLYFAGNTVIIDHGQGLYSYFAHLSSFDVKEGDRVERLDVVGRVGATGRVTGPHLHWTVRLVEARVDPLSLMAVVR